MAEHGIRIFIGSAEDLRRFVPHLLVRERLEADKVDVLLVGENDGDPQCFGVVHVKASFAERRTDDVPLSVGLLEAGFASPLWTMDCKSQPAASPLNRGELGQPLGRERDGRSAKRKDIEDDGYFSACFSYNTNTVPTPSEQDARGRVVVCDFTHPADDAFTTFVVDAWTRFRRDRLGGV